MRSKPSPNDLRVGDRIRIIGLPGASVPGYYLHPGTRRVFKKLIARKSSVRVARIDEYGSPWYTCRFRMNDGGWESHDLAVCEGDDNWVKVPSRRKKKG